MDESHASARTGSGTVSVEQKAFEDFKEYAVRTHELCRYLLQLAMVVFYALPFILLVFRAMTGTDKVVLLLVWILFMFALAIFLIFVSFFDKRLKERSEQLYNTPLDELGVIGPNSALGRGLQEQIEARRNERLAVPTFTRSAQTSAVSSPSVEAGFASAYPWEDVHPFTATVPVEYSSCFTVAVPSGFARSVPLSAETEESEVEI